jgi:hypothetical protein
MSVAAALPRRSVDAARHEGKTGSVTPRRIVLAYAASTAIGWVLAAINATRLPSSPYVGLDVVLDAAVIAGLLLLWRAAWVAAVVLASLGELFCALHPVRWAALLR